MHTHLGNIYNLARPNKDGSPENLDLVSKLSLDMEWHIQYAADIYMVRQNIICNDKYGYLNIKIFSMDIKIYISLTHNYINFFYPVH